MTPKEEELKKEIKNKWKDAWLIKKESKCWWEKMVDESFQAGQLASNNKLNEIITKRIKQIDKELKGMRGYDYPDYPEDRQELIDANKEEMENKLIGEKEGLKRLIQKIKDTEGK